WAGGRGDGRRRGGGGGGGRCLSRLPAAARAATRGEPSMNPTDRASILVVDDEEGVRSFLADALAGAGHAVMQAEDGERALALIASRAFHVVLTDLRMPGMDGMALLRELRREHPA